MMCYPNRALGHFRPIDIATFIRNILPQSSCNSIVIYAERIALVTGS